MKIKNLEKLFINPQATLKEGISIIENGQLKIALVVNEKKQLLGLLSDGDVRRGLLDDVSLSDSILKVMNKEFISVDKEKDEDFILALMKKNSILQVPIINKKNIILDLFVHKSLLNQETKSIPNPVVLMAGGKGKRLRPLTQNCPKPMIKINGKPILEILINKLSDKGFKNFYISVNYLKEQIIDYFGDGSEWGINIKYIIENEPLGTAGSLGLLPKDLKHPLLVMNADVLTNMNPLNLLNFHNRNKAKATLSVHNSDFEIPFGVVETKNIELIGFQEKPVYKLTVNAGVYVLNPEILKLLKKNVITDMPSILLKAVDKNLKVVVCPIHEYWIDIGRPEKLNQVTEYLSENTF